MIIGLPDKLWDMRSRVGLSQRAVAKYLSVSPAIISSYETGERTPCTENLLALSYLYHCSTDYLLGRDTEPQQTALNVDGLAPRQVQLFAELIETMKK